MLGIRVNIVAVNGVIPEGTKSLPEPILGLYSLNGKTPYRQIPLSIEAAKLGVIMIVSF